MKDGQEGYVSKTNRTSKTSRNNRISRPYQTKINGGQGEKQVYICFIGEKGVHMNQRFTRILHMLHVHEDQLKQFTRRNGPCTMWSTRITTSSVLCKRLMLVQIVSSPNVMTGSILNNPEEPV